MAFLPPCRISTHPTISHRPRALSQRRRSRTTSSNRPCFARALADDAPEDRSRQNLRVDDDDQKRKSRNKAREVSADQLEVVLKENARPLLVDAYAKWCGPCQFMVPQLDIIAERYGDRLDVVKLDTEEYADLASALLIRGLPTLFFIKEGKLRYRMEGALPAEELQALIEYVLFDGPPPKGSNMPPPQQDD